MKTIKQYRTIIVAILLILTQPAFSSISCTSMLRGEYVAHDEAKFVGSVSWEDYTLAFEILASARLVPEIRTLWFHRNSRSWFRPGKSSALQQLAYMRNASASFITSHPLYEKAREEALDILINDQYLGDTVFNSFGLEPFIDKFLGNYETSDLELASERRSAVTTVRRLWSRDDAQIKSFLEADIDAILINAIKAAKFSRIERVRLSLKESILPFEAAGVFLGLSSSAGSILATVSGESISEGIYVGALLGSPFTGLALLAAGAIIPSYFVNSKAMPKSDTVIYDYKIGEKVRASYGLK